MSSFIISKVEYVKAAGLMYGIESAKRDSHKYFLDVCRKEFEHVYALNVASVNEQYDHCEPIAPDENSYDDVFEAYCKKGELIGNDGYTSDDGIIFHQVEGVMTKRDLRKSCGISSTRCSIRLRTMQHIAWRPHGFLHVSASSIRATCTPWKAGGAKWSWQQHNFFQQTTNKL